MQTAGWLPGHLWVAFDLSGAISTDAWWVSIIAGITNLAPAMTWLQVGAYVAYGTVVLAVFLRGPVNPPVPRTASRPIRRRRWAIVAVAIVLPLLAVGAFAALAPSGVGPSQQITITASGCASDWKGGTAGPQTFTVVNKSGHGGEIYLIEAISGAVIGEIEGRPRHPPVAVGERRRRLVRVAMPDPGPVESAFAGRPAPGPGRQYGRTGRRAASHRN
ncbi:hypothetical protein [Fodinicola feengrottensis]|uniref:hypothetical protein n=1 Tax=Fodinicola feengrottensis TaxID=435914 RepID=UPI0024426094|nr:hypothetical protein [Fodinicola feengrottensis]